jgi:hypothetical protein
MKIAICLGVVTVMNVFLYFTWYLNTSAQIVQGSVLLLILIYSFYSIQIQIMPRSLYLMLCIATVGMILMLSLTMILLLLEMTGVGEKIILITSVSVIILISQALYFGFLFLIDCELLKLISVLSHQITEYRVNLLRNIWLPLYCIACIFTILDNLNIVAMSFARILAPIFGGIVLLFDLLIACYMFYKLAKLKRANLTAENVTEALFLLGLIFFTNIYALIGVSNPRMAVAELNDAQICARAVSIAAGMSLHYSIVVESFTQIRKLAISKPVKVPRRKELPIDKEKGINLD